MVIFFHKLFLDQILVVKKAKHGITHFFLKKSEICCRRVEAGRNGIKKKMKSYHEGVLLFSRGYSRTFKKKKCEKTTIKYCGI